MERKNTKNMKEKKKNYFSFFDFKKNVSVKNVKKVFKTKNVEKSNFFLLLFFTIIFSFTILYFYIFKHYNEPLKFFEQYIYCNNNFLNFNFNSINFFNNNYNLFFHYNFFLLFLQFLFLILTYYFLFLLLKFEGKKSFFERKIVLYTIITLLLTPTFFNIIQNSHILIYNIILLFLFILFLRFNFNNKFSFLHFFLFIIISSTIIFFFFNKLLLLYYLIIIIPLSFKTSFYKNIKYRYIFFSSITTFILLFFIIKTLFYIQPSILFQNYTFFYNSFIYEYSNILGFPIIIYFLYFLSFLFVFDNINVKSFSFFSLITFFSILIFLKEYNIFLLIPLIMVLFNSIQYIFYNNWNYNFTKNILLLIIFSTLIVSSLNNFSSENKTLILQQKNFLEDNILVFSSNFYPYSNCFYTTTPKNYEYNSFSKTSKILSSNNILNLKSFLKQNNISMIVIDKNLLLEKVDKENSGFFTTKKFFNITKKYDLFYYNRMLEFYSLK